MSGIAFFKSQLFACFIFIIASINCQDDIDKDGVTLSQSNLNAIYAVFAILTATIVGLTAAFVCLYKRVTAKKAADARLSTTISEHQYEPILYNTQQMKSRVDPQGYLVPTNSQSNRAKSKISEKTEIGTSNRISVLENKVLESKNQESHKHIYEKIPDQSKQFDDVFNPTETFP